MQATLRHQGTEAEIIINILVNLQVQPDPDARKKNDPRKRRCLFLHFHMREMDTAVCPHRWLQVCLQVVRDSKGNWPPYHWICDNARLSACNCCFPQYRKNNQ